MLTFKQFLLENIEEDTTLEYNDTLNQKLFDENDHLKPEVRDVLLKFAYKWVEFVKIIPQNIIVDIYGVGANFNYNYTQFSDIDVHIVIDMNKLKEHIRDNLNV